MIRTNEKTGTEAGITQAAGPFRAGFSLIEVLISLVILSVGLLAVAQMQVAAIQSIAFSRHMTSATYLARQQLEFLRGLPYDDGNPTVAPVGAGGSAIVAKGNKSVLLDDNNGTAGGGGACGDQAWGSTLEHIDNPLNEEGVHTTGGMPYYVIWHVVRGLNELCTACLTADPPCPVGPNQMAIEMQVIWWENREDMPSAPNFATSTWGQLESTGAHRVVLSAIRQPNL